MKNKISALFIVASISSGPAIASNNMLEGALYAIGITGAISYIVDKNGQTRLQEQQQREYMMSHTNRDCMISRRSCGKMKKAMLTIVGVGEKTVNKTEAGNIL